ITLDSEVDCPGSYMVGNQRFLCHDGHAHGRIGLVDAISKSCNVFFYKYGLDTGSRAIGHEAERFGLDRPTGIELPHETRRMIVPTPAWFQRVRGRQPYSGDTANLSIGQGDLGLTPLQMA